MHYVGLCLKLKSFNIKSNITKDINALEISIFSSEGSVNGFRKCAVLNVNIFLKPTIHKTVIKHEKLLLHGAMYYHAKDSTH